MIGNMNDRYRDLGRLDEKIDDVENYINERMKGMIEEIEK